MPSPQHAIPKLATVLILVAVSCGLAGCAVASPSPDLPPATQSETGQPDAGSSDTGVTDNEQRFGADLDTTGQVIARVLENVNDYSISGTTLTITFSEGSSATNADGPIACLSVRDLMSEDEKLILEYPDGSTEC